MDIQQILVYISLTIAIGFLAKKFFWKKSTKKSKPAVMIVRVINLKQHLTSSLQ
jgi:hypothetical protein